MLSAFPTLGRGRRLPAFVREGLRYVAVIPIVAVSTGVAELFYRITGSDRLSSIFLAGVFVAAFLLGSGPAYVSAGLAFGVYLFLVDPRFQWTFGGAEDFNVLMLFLAVAVLTSALAGRMRAETGRARARQQVSVSLLAATQGFSASSDEGAIREGLARGVSEVVGGPAALLSGSVVTAAPGVSLAPGEIEAFRDAEGQARGGGRTPAEVGGWRMRALRAGDQFLGVAGWRAGGATPSADQLAMLYLLIDTGAAAIARARLAAAKSDAESRARTEDLRNALLSSISHDLRTPLASILASASSLKEFGESFDAATRRDLAATLEEEARRLDASVANLLSMTRLEAGALSIDRTPFAVAESVQRVVDRRALGPRIALAVEGDPPSALGDPLLFEQALGNVVENAIRYAAGPAPLAVTVRPDRGRIEVSVEDQGPGVAPGDEDRIFEKFYRGRTAPRAPGTGLGLSIARGLMRAMGGEAAAHNRNGGPGLAVQLTLEAAE